MAEDNFITLKDESITIGDATLNLVRTVEKGCNKLEESFILSYNEEDIVGGKSWVFDVNDDNKANTIKVLDHHWKEMKTEFDDLLAQADFYHHVKEKNKGRTSNPLTQEFLREISDVLLNQRIPDEDFAEGKIDMQYYPLTSESHRFTALRNALDVSSTDIDTVGGRLTPPDASGMELDRFEQGISELEANVNSIAIQYDRNSGGHSYDDGMQFTAGGYDDDREEWRGDQHPDNSESWRGKVHKEVADNFDVDDEDEDRDEDDDEKTSWQEESNTEGSPEQRVGAMLVEYQSYVADFTNSANRLWMDAVESIYDGRPLRQNARELEMMLRHMDEAAMALEWFKKAATEADLPAYETGLIVDSIEDEHDGPQARMQKLIDMATKPALLEPIIKKSLNIHMDNDISFGM